MQVADTVGGRTSLGVQKVEGIFHSSGQKDN